MIILLVIAWKHKTWTAKSVWEKGKDKIDRLREKRWAAKKRKKENAGIQEEGKEKKKKEKPQKEKKPKREKKPKQAKHLFGKKKSEMDAGNHEEESYEEVE